MPTAYKVLGQSAPAATTATTLYTVPAATSAVTSTVVACNRGTAEGTYRIAVRPAGAALANQHYIAYGVPLAAGAVYSIQGGLTLANTDVVTVYSTTGNSVFSAFGSDGN